MKTAICTFRYDTVSKKYESDFVLLDKQLDETHEIYISPSPKVENRGVKYASGSKSIQSLWKEHYEFLKQNETISV